MHTNCLNEIKLFIDKYLDKNKHLKILDVGSANVNRSPIIEKFNECFNNPNWEYIGLDIVKGKNVNIVSEEPYKYPFPDNSIDVVVCVNTLEHVEDLHEIIKEISRISKDLVCIIAPNTWEHHAYPIDCWRIFPDGMKFLLKKIGSFEILECRISNKDTIGIARKIYEQ